MKCRRFISKIKINPAFVLLFAAFYISDMVFVYFLALLCGLWHELGHLCAMKLVGNRTGTIHIHPFGIGILKGESKLYSYQKDIFVYIAGPLFNLLASVIFYLLFSDMVWWNREIASLIGINLVLFLFNLMPVFTLDGGRILFSVLLLITSDHKAYAIMKAVSWCTVVLMLVSGVFILYLTQYNVSLLLAGIYLLFTMKKQ